AVDGHDSIFSRESQRFDSTILTLSCELIRSRSGFADCVEVFAPSVRSCVEHQSTDLVFSIVNDTRPLFSNDWELRFLWHDQSQATIINPYTTFCLEMSVHLMKRAAL